MASVTAALAKQIFAVIEGFILDIPGDQNHVSRVAGLTSGLGVLFGKQWPEPVLVVAVGFLHAGGGSSIALVAGRAPELVGIVNGEKFGVGMAGERFGVFVGLFLALGSHRGQSDLDGLARVHVAGFAAIDDVRLRHVDLNDGGVPLDGSLLQAIDLLGGEIHEMVGDVFVHLGLGIGDGFAGIAEFEAELGFFVADVVVSLFQFVEIELLPATVRGLDGSLLIFVFPDFLRFAVLGGFAIAGFKLIGQRVDLGAPIGENTLYGEQPGV